MKHRTGTLKLLLALLLVLFSSSRLFAQGAGAETLELLMVEASNNGGGMDPALAPYSTNLKRIFNFDTFQLRGKTGLRVAAGQTSSASLQGQTIKVSSAGVEGGRLEAKLEWSDGSRSLLSTGLKLQKGVPAVLGGPRTKSGSTYLILVNW